MNCREFESQAATLWRRNQALQAPADPQVIPQAVPQGIPQVIEAAMRHAESCAACSIRLAEQRELSAQLRQLSASDAHCGPSPEQEHRLRAAWRASHRAEDRPIGLPAATGNWKPWAVAAAAMFLAALGGIAVSRKVPDWLAMTPTELASEPAATRAAEIPRFTAPAAGTQSLAGPKAPRRTTGRSAEARRGAMVNAPVVSPRNASPQRSDSVAADSPLAAIGETASDFVLLPYDGDPMLAGSGPVVRVEMTGAMLQSLGFPIAGESAARRVKADLVLGQDGLARAIRFVQ